MWRKMKSDISKPFPSCCQSYSRILIILNPRWARIKSKKCDVVGQQCKQILQGKTMPWKSQKMSFFLSKFLTVCSAIFCLLCLCFSQQVWFEVFLLFAILLQAVDCTPIVITKLLTILFPTNPWKKDRFVYVG